MATFRDYASRGETMWWRYPACLLLAVAMAIAFGAVVFARLSLLGLVSRDVAVQMAQPSHPYAFFGGVGVVSGVLLTGLVLSAFIVHKKRPADIVGDWKWRAFFFGIALWLVVEIVTTLFEFLIAPRGFKITLNGGMSGAVACAFVALFVQTFTEEFLFRGYLTQGLLLATRKPVIAAALSGLIFGSMHIPNGTTQAIGAVAFGFVCSLIAMRSAGIAFTSGLHFINNFFAAAVVVSGGDVFRGGPGLVRQDTPQLLWLDLVVTIIALVIVRGIVTRWYTSKDQLLLTRNFSSAT